MRNKNTLDSAMNDICKKHKPKKLSYVAMSDWAERKIKMGHIQKQCPDCKRYFFKCEF